MQKFKIRNWSEYNKSLIQRGSIIFWISNDGIQKWLSSAHTGQAGRPPVYSDDAILLLLILREVYGLPLRALQGFLISLFLCMKIDLPVPSYSQISRRAKVLGNKIPTLLRKNVKDIILDSSGLKVFGEGEWKVRTHGKDKRRIWKKFHIGIDANTQEVALWELTNNNEGDCAVGQFLLKQVKGKLGRVLGDGSYDGQEMRKIIFEKHGKPIIIPPKNATYKGSLDGWVRERDLTLAEIHALGGGEEGRSLWKKLHGYHERSLVETFFSRVKRRLGGSLKARTEGTQRAECASKCIVMNRMTTLGMPKGRWIIKE